MNLINWRPKTVSSYHSLPNAFERMIDDNFFVNYYNNNWTPSVDINESSDTFIIKADLPGIKKSDIEVKIEENVLSFPLKEAREKFEKDYLASQLKKHKGNISKTAEFVGMERSALHRKLKSLGIKGIN